MSGNSEFLFECKYCLEILFLFECQLILPGNIGFLFECQYCLMFIFYLNVDTVWKYWIFIPMSILAGNIYLFECQYCLFFLDFI